MANDMPFGTARAASRATPTAGRSKASIVFESLREEILNGTMGPNERLVERDLVERFGVSKTPVREALSMLRNEGLARGRYYRGMIVVHMSPHALHDLYDLREALEGLAARSAATIRNARLIEELTANVMAQESALFTTDSMNSTRTFTE